MATILLNVDKDGEAREEVQASDVVSGRLVSIAGGAPNYKWLLGLKSESGFRKAVSSAQYTVLTGGSIATNAITFMDTNVLTNGVYPNEADSSGLRSVFNPDNCVSATLKKLVSLDGGGNYQYQWIFMVDQGSRVVYFNSKIYGDVGSDSAANLGAANTFFTNLSLGFADVAAAGTAIRIMVNKSYVDRMILRHYNGWKLKATPTSGANEGIEFSAAWLKYQIRLTANVANKKMGFSSAMFATEPTAPTGDFGQSDVNTAANSASTTNLAAAESALSTLSL